LVHRRQLDYDGLRETLADLLNEVPGLRCVSAYRTAEEEVHTNGAPMSMSVARKVIGFFGATQLSASPLAQLTPREREILERLARGRCSREIGEDLNIAPATVGADLHSVYRKLHQRRPNPDAEPRSRS
jgi:DNA-binding CsgD family transcriptional regulator